MRLEDKMAVVEREGRGMELGEFDGTGRKWQ
jgi:hypothetical protein